MQTNLLEEYQRLQTGESTRAVAYLRLRRALQNLMDAGVLRPGQALPSERDLAELPDLPDLPPVDQRAFLRVAANVLSRLPPD